MRGSIGAGKSWQSRDDLAAISYNAVPAEGGFLGAHFLTDNASGLVNAVRLAMVTGMTATELCRQSIMSPYLTRESDLIYMLKPLLP